MEQKKVSESKQKEVDDNFDAFQKLMSENKISSDKVGKYALMKNGEIKGYFTTWDDAYQAGSLKYHNNIFSIQEVVRDAVDLGYYSRVVV